MISNLKQKAQFAYEYILSVSLVLKGAFNKILEHNYIFK